MPVTVTWGTKIINVPQDYLDDLGGDVYELDTNQMRLDLKALEDNEEGILGALLWQKGWPRQKSCMTIVAREPRS